MDDANGDRRYSTTDKEEYMTYLRYSYDPLSVPYPVWLLVEDGQVVSITEDSRFMQ